MVIIILIIIGIAIFGIANICVFVVWMLLLWNDYKNPYHKCLERTLTEADRVGMKSNEVFSILAKSRIFREEMEKKW